MAASTPSERRVNAKIAAHARWSRETNRSLATAKARAASPSSLAYWLSRVDPAGEMAYRDRVRAAENAMAEYFGRAMKNARAAKRATRNNGSTAGCGQPESPATPHLQNGAEECVQVIDVVAEEGAR